MDAAFHRAALPDPVTVLGVRLQPFSVGHAILFKRFQIAFLEDDDKPQLNDFILGVILCACRYEQAVEVFEDPQFNRTVARWLKKSKGFRMQDELRKFFDYLSTGLSEVPWFARPDTGGAIEGAPFEQILKVTLLSRLNLTESEVLNRPYSLAIWDYLTIKALDGQITLLDKAAEPLRRQAADDFDRKWKEKNGHPA